MVSEWINPRFSWEPQLLLQELALPLPQPGSAEINIAGLVKHKVPSHSDGSNLSAACWTPWSHWMLQ